MNIKVGDRVRARFGTRLTGTVDWTDGVRATVIADNGDKAHGDALDFRRLVKRRKPAPSADRVMVAATLMPWIFKLLHKKHNEDIESYWTRLRQMALEEADKLIAEAAK